MDYADASAAEANSILSGLHDAETLCRDSPEYAEAMGKLTDALVGYRKAQLRLEFLRDSGAAVVSEAELAAVEGKYFGALKAAEVLENRAEDC